MARHINRQGEQLILYIPKDLFSELGWIPNAKGIEGTPVVVERRGDELIIRALKPKVSE